MILINKKFIALYFPALRRVIAKYSAKSLPPVPKNNKKTGYGRIKLEKTASLFDTLDIDLSTKAIESENPISMEAAGQVSVLVAKKTTFLFHHINVSQLIAILCFSLSDVWIFIICF